MQPQELSQLIGNLSGMNEDFGWEQLCTVHNWWHPMNLIDVTKALATDDQCLDFLERMRWPNGVRARYAAATITARARGISGNTLTCRSVLPRVDVESDNGLDLDRIIAAQHR